MYKAIINTVEKTEDELTIKVEFSNGTESFEKEYRFVHMVDINTSFEETIKNELKRMNDLEEGYIVLKAREKEEINLVK